MELRIRIKWDLGSGVNYGYWHSFSDYLLLSERVANLNRQYGQNTHWNEYEK